MGAARIRGTLPYFKCTTWGNLVRRCVNTGKKISPSSKGYQSKGTELRMTRSDWYSFCDARAELISLFYKQGKTPSIDRIDPDGHYQINNIQIISFEENRLKDKTKEKMKKATVAAAKSKFKPVYVKTTDFEVTFLSIKYFREFFNLSAKITHNLANGKAVISKPKNLLVVRKLTSYPKIT